MTREGTERKRNAPRLAELVALLEQEGPDMTRVSHLMDESEATVRYWFKKRLIDNGFRLRCVMDRQRLGLTRVLAVVKISRQHVPLANKIFAVLSESAYITYTAALMDGNHLLIGDVPDELLSEFGGLVKMLEAKGLWKVVEMHSFDWFRVLPMKSEYYDFENFTWELGRTKPVARSEIVAVPAKKQAFDDIDLRIVERLQVDADVTVKQIAKKLGIAYKRTLRHYRHVIDGRFLSYTVAWPRTNVSPHTHLPRSTVHSALPLSILAWDLANQEIQALILALHALPFLWAEMGGADYFAEMVVPLELVNETLAILYNAISPIRDKCRILFYRPNDIFAYTIAPGMFDAKTRRWTFQPESVMATISSVLLLVPPAPPVTI